MYCFVELISTGISNVTPPVASIETSLAPNTISQTQRYADIVYLQTIEGNTENTFKFRLQIGDAG